MTMIDIPMTFEFDPPEHGEMRLEGTSAEALRPYFGPDATLPACTSMEIVKVAILDPDRWAFARPGFATSP